MSKEIITEIKFPAQFRPRARLLIQLGDQLIKNETIALVELIKNSYDADANVVTVLMENLDDAENGVIIIEDDGYGMDMDTVQNVWLEPGSDFKAQKIKRNETSPKYNRLPIGEKGIGRFGVHKLGNTIEMTTKHAGREEVHVSIDWSDFENYKYLEDVPISIYKRSTPKIFTNGRTGTYIVIKNLRKDWIRGEARSARRAVTSLISPFETIDSFKPELQIVDKPGWLEGLLTWEDVKHYSLFHFDVTIENDEIISFKYEFTPWASMPKLAGRVIDLQDEQSGKLVQAYKKLEDEDGKKYTLNDVNIGQVRFEGYIFDRDNFVMKLGVADKKGFSDYLRSNSGVRVFRDGLRVYDYGEPENDWLGLDLRRVQAPAKRISNNLILGAVYLNRKDSSDLKEKTNREGFVENRAYQKFRDAILHCIEIVESLRVTDKKVLKDTYGPTPVSEPVMHVLGELKSYVDKHVTEPTVRYEISKYLVKIEEDYKRVNENLLKAAGAGLSMSVVVHEVEKIILEVQKIVEKEIPSPRLLALIKHLSSLIDGYAEIIRKSTQTREDIKQVISQSLFNTEFRLKAHSVEVVRDYQKFKGDSITKLAKSLLIGCLMNLVDNSIYWLQKAKDQNPALEKKIFITLSHEEPGHLNLIFADNGTGFLLPTADIVEPFVSGKPGGIGLGLHIAQEIMNAHGGKLHFPQVGDFDLPEEFKNGAIIAFAFKIK